MSVKIPIGGRSDVFAIVDDIDQDLLKFNWYLNTDGYVIRSVGKTTRGIHRWIMERALGRKINRKEEVDHINCDKLDNRRSNLRITNRSQNCSNVNSRQRNTSGYIGVSYYKAMKKWRADITVNGKRMYLGSYETCEEAARVRDEAAKKYKGEYTYLNFPDE